MLNQFLFATVENGLNALLQTDRTTLRRLQALAGQVIEIQSTQPSFRLYVVLHGEGVQLAQRWETSANCTLTATANQLVQLAISQEKTRILHEPGLSIEGNSGLLMEFAQILEDMQLDWQYLLHKWLGPVAAGLISGHIGTRASWLKQSAVSLKANFADYLAEETRLLVGQKEAQVRFNELEQLKLQLDRLEARAALISQRISPSL